MRKIKRLAIVFVAAMIVVLLVIPFTAYCAELKIGEEYWYNVGYIYGTILQVDGKPAFCVDPDAALPTSGSYTGSVETNPALLKIL